MRTREELLRAWVDALEGGKYPQAKGTLRTKDGYCCLGVACDVSGLGQWESMADVLAERDEYGDSREAECSDSTHVFNAQHARSEIGLPGPLFHRVGLTTEQERELQCMNDEFGATFQEIAHRIREWFPDIFATVST